VRAAQVGLGYSFFKSEPSSPSAMHEYPGLGLPLRYTGTQNDDFYPIGAHEACEGATSDLLPVREVAMMNIMEQLTDKHNWHEKVFDYSIVSKWREEALKIPDEELWDLATRGKQQVYNDDGSVTVQTQYSMQGVVPLTGILTETVFDRVSICCPDQLILTFNASASVSCEKRLYITRKATSYLPLMLARA
jgi:hypothetical protein